MSRRATRRPSKNVMRVLLVAAALGAGVATVALASGNDSPRTPSLTARIVLDRSRVLAGGTVSGRVIFDNRRSKPKLMLRGCVASGLYAIGFSAADGYFEQPVFVPDGCSSEQSMVAEPGRTTFRFKTRASFTACGTAPGQPKRSPEWLPPCGKKPKARGGRPSLPVGEYTAVFVPSGTWHGPRVNSASLSIVHAG